MAISTIANYLTRINNASQRVPFYTTSIINGTAHWMSSTWRYTRTQNGYGAPAAVTAPTTAGALDNTTAGVLGQTNGGTGALRIMQLISGFSNATAGFAGGLLICDRLSHQGGLSGVTTGEQTTNLPTTALSRYTGGAGVMIGIEIHTTVGASSTTISARYTNQAAAGSHATTSVPFGTATHDPASRFIILPLQSGDTGVKSVEGVTIAATTGTAGAFGVVLFKPLMLVPIYQEFEHDYDVLFGLGAQMPEILDNSALFCIGIPAQAAAISNQGVITFAED